MTKEELEKETAEYFKSICGDYNEEYERTGKRHYWVGFDIKNAYLAGAEPREKQIQIDAEQIRALQKQNGELTDENERLKGDLELWESGACRATNLDKCGVVKELEVQIEKMSETLLGLLWFEEHLDPYMYDCNDAQKGELLKPFDNARLFLEKYKCKKCKGEGTIKVGYNGWATNPCPACEGKGYILRR